MHIFTLFTPPICFLRRCIFTVQLPIPFLKEAAVLRGNGIKKALWAIILVLFAAILAALFINIYTPATFWFIDKVNLMNPEKNHYTLYYQDNKLCYSGKKLDFENSDIREIQVGNGKKYLINHSRGFALEFPRDAKFDFSAAQEYITAENKDMRIVVSKEYTTYTDGSLTRAYIADYLHKYMLNDKYIENNKITVHKNAVEYINGNWVQVVALSRLPAPGSDVNFNTYVYCYVYTGTPMFYRIMFNAADYDDTLINQVYKTLYTFEPNIKIQGVSDNFTDYKPEIPANWSKETREFYDTLISDTNVKWGIFQPHNIKKADLSETIELEKKLNYRFDGVLEYLYFGEDIPIDGMNLAYEDGKIIELTVQTSTVMNEDLDGYNPVFDILDGVHDDQIYTLARQIKSYGHPILFRLNNEMNSDWTSYGVSACLNDPQIYVRLWHRIYDIFEEVGVDNTIWVFNPNDESYPPHGYNSTQAFYPGDKYVQVFGVTGYNTGTFYAAQNNEKWKTFDDIYGHVYERHYETYKNFPWIITEFASSSVGGDKVLWINDMFNDFSKYPNIKMAFWFNSADYYTDTDGKIKVSRPYWLDETEDTLQAFKNGLAASGAQK